MAADVDAEGILGAGAASHQHTEPLACVSCRSRKLKCDRTKPACSRCVKVNNECLYPESRRKPAFKRKNVKELEARLAQVEDYLKEVTKNGEDGDETPASSSPSRNVESQNVDCDFAAGQPNQSRPSQSQADIPWEVPDFISRLGTDNVFGNSQLMDLGITEALPPFEVMEELTTLFFTHNHVHIPIVHPGRYWQAFYGAPLRRPPMSLQYAMWAMAAQFHCKYDQYSEIFYKRARQYAEADEMKGSGEHFVTVAHAQAYAIIATFEAKCMLFTRAALTTAKCVRLVDMMGLDRLDAKQDDIPPTLGPATSWVETEERRRTFWGAFAIDSHASISTGWPSLINSADVVTRLPASEEAFLSCTEEEQSAFLDDVFKGAGYSGFAGTIVICAMFKSIMHHIYREKPKDRPEDLMNGLFWERHRTLDNELSSVFMFLPDKLTLPQNIREPTALYTNLNLHASVICLHHAAVEKAEKYGHVDTVKRNSISRLRASAEEIANIIKLTSHNTGVFKSPLSALSLYCASTVYIYVAKDDPKNGLTSIDKANLELLISSMEAIGREHYVTRAFLQQASLDIERNGLDSAIYFPGLKKYRNIFHGPCSNIPLIARNAVGRHSDLSPVLPGRLPLSKPQGKLPPSNLRMSKTHLAPPYENKQEEHHPMFMGVARTTIAVKKARNDTHQSHKRKRMSPTPAPSGRVNLGMMGMSARDSERIDMGVGNQGDRSAFERASVSGGRSQPMRHGNITLPDRTNSSASSSPRNQGTGYAETQSGSSHTSPGVFGLGNTAEENRVDLRPFQGRMSTPIWQDEVLFGQISDTIVNNALAVDGADPWGILNEELDWGTNPLAK